MPDKITGGDKDKVTRARLLEARAAAKKVVRPEDAPWWVEFAQEALYFPAGAHDDQIDALSGAVRLAGFSASSIAWQYGVWKCVKCKHQFRWEKGRHCPKCGLLVPDTYENPEMVGVGVGRCHQRGDVPGSRSLCPERCLERSGSVRRSPDEAPRSAHPHVLHA